MPSEVAKTLDNQRKKKIQAAKSRLRILIIIGLLLLLLFSIVLFAALRAGGLSNLIKGDKDPLSNTLNNIGTSFTDTSKNEPMPEPLTLPGAPQDQVENRKKNDLQNYITFETFDNGYEATIKKDTFVYFINKIDTAIGLKFSDGRDLKLNALEEKNMMFTKVGDISFIDKLDTTGEPIKGVIHVIAN